MKRFMSTMLILVLLITLATPTFAATNDAQHTERPTIEDIINEYHEKCFAMELSAETKATITNSNLNKLLDINLEEETVNELRAAGYEAYNVTSTNYDSLENTLNTNFTALGLDPSGSYIIVISTEDNNDDSSNPNARFNSDPGENWVDPNDGGSFLYYYEPFDTYYKLRYVWVTYNPVSKVSDIVSQQGTNYANTLANSNITCTVTSNSIYTASNTLGTLRNLWGLDTTATYSSPMLSVTCSVTWTRKYVEVYDEVVDAWDTTTYYESASTKTVFSGRYYNNRTASYNNISYTSQVIVYSPNYGNDAYLKVQAIMFHSAINPTYDRTHEIQVRATDQNGNMRVLVTVYETW